MYPVMQVMQAFVGRESERQRLANLLEAASNENPVSAFISADAGIGKSSLVRWLATYAEAHGALVLQGSCDRVGSGAIIPYGPLADALRKFVRSKTQPQAQNLMGKVWPTLSTLFAESIGHPGSNMESVSQRRIFGAVLRLPDEIGRYAPLVLIFEDIHWADASTIDLIQYLTRAKTDQKLMLVCSFRPPGSRHPLQHLLSEPDFRSRVNQINLPPFSEPDLDAFAEQLTGSSVPSERLKRYFELSEGNAYFAEQLIMADDLRNPDVEVPQSLREAMMARLLQLSEGATEVVRIAAVAGRTLDDNMLAAVSELDERSLDKALQECVQQRILVSETGQDTYTFQHALLRDTAYRDLLLPRTRKRIHARIAAALSASPHTQARHVPELAFHWFEAGQPAEAFTATLRAAGQAVRVHAFPEAHMHYERALRLWPEVPDVEERAGEPRQHLLGLAADAARWANEVTRALQWVREAIAEVDEDTDEGRAGELQERLGSYLWEAGEYEGAAAAYAKAGQLLSGLPPSAVASRVQSALATVAIRTGDYRGGLRHAQKAVDLASTAGAKAEEGRALNSLGLALTFSGSKEGEQPLRTALALAAEADHLEDLLRAYGNLCVFLEHEGRLGDTVMVATEGLERAREHGLLGTRQSDVLRNNAAAALVLLGQYTQAAELLDAVLQQRPLAESLYARLTRAEVHVAQGSFDGAEALLNEIGSMSSNDPRFLGPLHVCWAEAAAWQGRLGPAREHVVKGTQAIAGSANARVVAQLCAIGLRIAAELDDRQWAEELFAVMPCDAQDSPELNETSLLAKLCHAELARISKQDNVAMWAELAGGWQKLNQPFRMAYAQGWLAAAASRARDREEAGAVIREAYATAIQIGAEPLASHLLDLGRELRLPVGPPRPFNLTNKERAVLNELATGKKTIEIAETLSIKANTVGVHIGSILRKMGVGRRADAVRLAREKGIIP